MLLNYNFTSSTGAISPEDCMDLHIAKLDLLHEKCGLSHGPEDMEIEIPYAVDYLCQCLGFNKEKSITDMLRIPICDDCIRGLYDRNEVLLYCVHCNHSQWVWKPESKINYNTNVVWLDQCPKCFNIE